MPGAVVCEPAILTTDGPTKNGSRKTLLRYGRARIFAPAVEVMINGADVMSEPMPVYEVVNREFECTHEERVLRRRECANGTIQYIGQCLQCGQTGRPIAHSRLTDTQKAQATDIDESIADTWLKLRNKRSRALQRERRMSQYQEWRELQKSHGQSGEWKAKKNLVFRRDGYICQACLTNPAEEVHHTTYEYGFGNEPAYTLKSVCKPCHRKITQMDRKRRGETWLGDVE